MKRLTTAALAAAALCLSLAAPAVHAQSMGQALGGLLGSIGKQQPSQNNSAGNLIGNLVGGGQAAGQPNTLDLVKMLSQSVEEIDEPKEIDIGRQLAAVLLGSKPLYGDMNVQRYVNQLGRWISLQSPRPNLPWTFIVLDDSGYNAFAAPGGFVFVTRGLLEQVRDEAELAGILAHEITHVTSKHHLQAMRKTARAGLLTSVVSAKVGGGVGGAISQQMLALGKDMYSKGLDQEDEFEADRKGVALAAAAGFDPYGLVAAVQQLRTVTPDNPAFTLTLSTHPPAQTRLDQLETAMGNRLDSYTGAPSMTIAQRMDALAAANRPVQASVPPPASKAPAKKK